MKAVEQYFLVVLFTTLYEVNWLKTLVCDHSNESCEALLSFGTSLNPGVAIQMKAVVQYFSVMLINQELVYVSSV